MKARLRKLWESRSPRDRAVISVLAVVLSVAGYAALVLSAERARTQLRASVTTLRSQAARVEQQAAELGRLRNAPTVSASPTDLRTLVQTLAGDAGLSRSLVRVDAPDPDQVVVVFGAVAFADWLAWINTLKAQQVRLDTCRIEAMSTPGLVGITATLVRPKAQ
jgi:general secretion pathway protein M